MIPNTLAKRAKVCRRPSMMICERRTLTIPSVHLASQQDHITEVQNKWNTLKLNDDIWAKLIYFEKNRRLAKAYVSAPVLTVDGSTNGLDGFRIGLSGIDNTYRQLESISCLRSIGLGIKLKIDGQGNILVRRQTNQAAPAAAQNCSIWVKDWPQSSNDGSTRMRQLNQSDGSYKLFDMRKFRLQMEKRNLLRHYESNDFGADDEEDIDWRQCVSVISFVCEKSNNIKTSAGQQPTRPSANILEDPCWLMIINIIAIDMLKSSICDKRLGAQQQRRVQRSGLIKNHSLLACTDNGLLGQAAKPAPLRTSSSAAILYSESNASGQRASSVANTLEHQRERLKKSRTQAQLNQQSRLPLMKRSNQLLGSMANSRRFQSSQQLAPSQFNNTIYTTFNSRNRKLASQMDNLSTSDYNSASRSSSSGGGGQIYWRKPHQFDSLINTDRIQASQNKLYKQQQNFPLMSRRTLIDENYPVGGNGNSDKCLSLSNFDLSQRRIFNLKSIKMNYDYVTENEDDEQEAQATASSRRTIESFRGQEDAYCCDLRDQVELPKLSINHHECSAMQSNDQADDKASKQQQQQKVVIPKSSLASSSSNASSSSSSGCGVDSNDYFLSHQSSSSMSSSSTNAHHESQHDSSNHSQPTSSSGIIATSFHSSLGSGSDEYELEEPASSGSLLNSKTADNLSAQPTSNKCPSSTTIKVIQNKNQAKSQSLMKLKRGLSIKKLEVAVDYHGHRGAAVQMNDDEPTECDCPSIILENSMPPFGGENDCDCCCDCFREPTMNPTKAVPDASRVEEEDEIYSRLPHPKSYSAAKCDAERLSPSPNKQDKKPSSRKAFIRRSGSTVQLSSTLDNRSGGGNFSYLRRYRDEQVSTRPMHQDESHEMDPNKRKSSWLDRSKYGRMIPKFMLFSSSSSSQTNYKNTQQIIGGRSKSNTLDRNGKFRMTRSTMELS